MPARILVAVVALAATASADPPRYARRHDLKIDAKLSDRVKPRPIATTPSKPAVSADAILAAEGAATILRQQQEAVLEQLVRDTPDTDPDKPELMFRLAEHYAYQLRLWTLKSTALQLEADRPR